MHVHSSLEQAAAWKPWYFSVPEKRGKTNYNGVEKRPSQHLAEAWSCLQLSVLTNYDHNLGLGHLTASLSHWTTLGPQCTSWLELRCLHFKRPTKESIKTMCIWIFSHFPWSKLIIMVQFLHKSAQQATWMAIWFLLLDTVLLVPLMFILLLHLNRERQWLFQKLK